MTSATYAPSISFGPKVAPGTYKSAVKPPKPTEHTVKLTLSDEVLKVVLEAIQQLSARVEKLEKSAAT